MSTSSFAPAASTFGWLASTASEGSFCLFCEKGPAGLPTVTKVSGFAAPASATITRAKTAPRRAPFPRGGWVVLSPISATPERALAQLRHAVGEVEHAVFVLLGSDELQSHRVGGAVVETRAVADEDGIDEEVELVDEAV